jgi:Domain of unknown function (DUF5665)
MSESGIPENRGYTNVTLPLGRMMLNNFLGGISWGIGTFVGATLVVGIVVWILGQTGLLHQLSQTFQDFQHTVETLKSVR